MRRLTSTQPLKRTLALAAAFAMTMVGQQSSRAASGTWDGLTDNTWAGANWGGVSPVPGIGDTATFNNAGNGNTTIDLGGGVSLSNLLFDTASVAAFGIGSGALGSQTLTLQTNSAISLNPGVANNQMINALIALPTNASAAVTFVNYSGSALTLAGGISAVPGAGNSLLTVTNSGDVNVTGVLTETGAGSLALLKTGSGKLTIATNAAWSGNAAIGRIPATSAGFPLVAREGTLLFNGGSNFVNGELVIGGVVADGGAGQNAKVVVSGNGILNVSSWFSLGRGNGIGGATSELVASNNAVIRTANLSAGFNGGNAANLPKGAITLYDNSLLNVTANGDVFQVGESDGSDMTLTVNNSASLISSGTTVVNVGRNNGTGALTINGGSNYVGGILRVGRGGNLNSTAKGTTTVNSGSLRVESDIVLGYAGNGGAGNLGKLEVSGGTVNMASTVTRWLIMNQFDTSPGRLDVNSGQLNLNANSSIRTSTGNASSQATNNVINLNGGAINFYSDNATTLGGTGELDLQRSGGANSRATFNLNGGTLNVPRVMATMATGSRTFNFNGGLLKAVPTSLTGTFVDLGIGGILNVRDGGAVIDSNGRDISIAQNLQHSDVAGDNATDGGLTKRGAGTLALTGGSSYTGPTTVNGGTLSLNPTAVFFGAMSALTISNANLALNVTGGAASINVGNVTLQNNAVINLTYGTLAANPTTPAIVASGAISAPGSSIVINFTGTGFTSGSFKVIDYTGAALANVANFSVLTPPGVVAVVSNNVAETSVDVMITSVGQLLTWYGSPSTTWDINTTANWNSGTAKYLEYGSYGDLVTFDDSAVDANVVLNTSVVPAQVVVNATTAYTISGSGTISGAGAITKNNTGTLALHTANTHTGGTIIAGGTLAITNDNALGSAAVPVTLAGGTLQAATSLSSSRGVAVTAASSLEVASGAAVTLNGVLTAGAPLTKSGSGALNVVGGSVSNTGALLIDAGVVSLPGNYTNTSFITVGNASGDATLQLSGNVAANHLYVGNFAGAHAAVTQTGGSAAFYNSAGDKLNLGQNGSYGYYRAAGGILNVDGIALGGSVFPTEWPPQGTGDGLLEIDGATVNNIGWITMSRGGSNNKSVLNMFSGLLTFGGGGIGCNWQLSGADQTSIINILGGNVTTTNQPVDFRTANTGILNLKGGLLQASAVTGFGNIGFNGGTLRPTAASANFISVSQTTVYSGGATIDDAGLTLTVNQALQAPTGYGVSAVNMSDAGSGYIAPPIVTISGGSGSNATAIAAVSGGVVTGITVVSPGTGYDAADFLTVTFTGGGAGAVPPTVGSISLVPNSTAGGFTKIGSGTLNLRGDNNYGGATRVNAGKLVVTPAHQTSGGLIVSNTASFAVSLPTTNGSATVGAITLAPGTTTLEFNFGTNQNTAAPILVAGPFTNYGTCVIRMTGPFSVGVVPLLDYTGTIQGGGSITPLIQAPQGVVATVSNSTANSMLYAVITEVGAGLVWRGTNVANPGAWDIGSTVNWTLGANPTVYTDGDTVIFNDLGAGTVNLTNPVSPVSVLISNNTTAYTFSGAGKISGTTGLTKQGTGTAIMGFTGNDYSGNTTINSGRLQLGSGTAIPEGPAAGTVTISANATLDAAGFSETINGLAGSGVIDNSSAAASTLTIGSGNAGGTWSGQITNSVGVVTVVKTGTGSLTITGTNYVGGTSQFNGGTNYLASTGSLQHIGTGEFWVQQNAGTSSFIMNGGSLSVNNWFVVGRNAATANGTFILNSGTVTKTGGGNVVIGSLNATGLLEINGGQFLNNSMLWLGENASANAVLRLNGGLLQATQVRPNNAVALSTAYFNGGTLQATAASADFISTATACNVQSGGLVLDTQAFGLTNAATLNEDGSSPGGGLVKLGSGTLALTAANTYSGATIVSNGTLLVDGSISTGAVTVRSGATLGGNGTIYGTVSVNAGGKLAAGSSIGTLTLAATPVLGGTVVAEIDRNGGSPLADQIVVSGGPITYGGTLVITNIGADLQVGDSFTLFNASGYGGSFTIVAYTPNQIVTWNNTLATDGKITVATVAPAVNTTPGTLVSSIVGNTLNLSWSPDRLGWTLQSNAVGVANSGSWYPVAGSAATTNVAVNIDANKTNVFFRLVYP